MANGPVGKKDHGVVCQVAAQGFGLGRIELDLAFDSATVTRFDVPGVVVEDQLIGLACYDGLASGITQQGFDFFCLTLHLGITGELQVAWYCYGCHNHQDGQGHHELY
ncbi:hypothetical protein D9M69_538780 [compost metagenome]